MPLIDLFRRSFGSQQNLEKSAGMSHLPAAPARARPPWVSTPSSRGAFTTIDGPTWRVLVAQSPWSTLGFALGVVRSVGWDNFMRTGTCHCTSDRYSHCRANPLCSACLFIPPPTPASGSHWSSYCIHSFAFSRRSESWNRTVCV